MKGTIIVFLLLVNILFLLVFTFIQFNNHSLNIESIDIDKPYSLIYYIKSSDYSYELNNEFFKIRDSKGQLVSINLSGFTQTQIDEMFSTWIRLEDSRDKALLPNSECTYLVLDLFIDPNKIYSDISSENFTVLSSNEGGLNNINLINHIRCSSQQSFISKTINLK